MNCATKIKLATIHNFDHQSLKHTSLKNVFDFICRHQMYNDVVVSIALAEVTKLYFERTHRQEFFLYAYKLVSKIANNKSFSQEEATLMLEGFTNLYNLKTETLSWSSDFYNFEVLISNMIRFTLESALKKVYRKPNYGWFCSSAVFTDKPSRVEATKNVKTIVSIDEINSIFYEKIMERYNIKA
ncbi:MAG TPA: hypothetical protein DCL21_04540 [Alphaproteobacteria bacterium]|nr:hypothetical protein [Alphaproteobacteria bacterium]